METTNKHKWRKRLFFIPLMLLGAAIMIALVMILWNWLMPAIFGLTAITFWQAVGLLLLSKLLFSGFNFNKKGRRPSFARKGMRKKFMNMTDEEKEKNYNARKKMDHSTKKLQIH